MARFLFVHISETISKAQMNEPEPLGTLALVLPFLQLNLDFTVFPKFECLKNI